MSLLRASLLAFLSSAACRAPESELASPVEHWGTLREVLREGRSEGRVELASVVGAHSVGVGVLAGLAGEIAVIDGETWIARASDATTWDIERGTPEGAQAAFLALKEVERWSAVAIDRDIAVGELGRWLERIGHEETLGSTWPFVIAGRFEALDAHILRGACPLADPNAPVPARPSRTSGEGRLVGFFARGSAGVLTHHGDLTHVHVVLERPVPFVGHVDTVAVRAGAVLLVAER